MNSGVKPHGYYNIQRVVTMKMSNRKRVLKTLSGKRADKIPKDAWWTPPALEMFKEKTGQSDPAKYFGCEMREVLVSHIQDRENLLQTVNYPQNALYLPTEKYLSAYKNVDDISDIHKYFRIDEWGVGYEPCSTFHFTHMKHPMEAYRTVKEILDYPFPQVANNRKALKSEIDDLKLNDYYVMGNIVAFVFEKAWHLRGIENLLVDFIENEEFAAVLLDKILEIKTQMALELASSGVDQINLGDDVGTQNSMIMHPAMWRKWIKPRFGSFIKAVKKANGKIRIFYHSDGFIEPIIPDLIEIGVDILNPVQPECMNPILLRQRYGQALTFWGVMGCQSTVRFGSPAQVELETKKWIDMVGQNGCLVLGLMGIEPDIPWENIISFFNAVEKYG